MTLILQRTFGKCDLYWRLYEKGIPVLTGPSLLAKILGCSVSCECDVVVHVDDLEHVDEKECVWWIEDPTFIYRYVWIGGYPHVALEDLKKLRGKDAEVLGCILEKIRNAPRAP